MLFAQRMVCTRQKHCQFKMHRIQDNSPPGKIKERSEEPPGFGTKCTVSFPERVRRNSRYFAPNPGDIQS